MRTVAPATGCRVALSNTLPLMVYRSCCASKDGGKSHSIVASASIQGSVILPHIDAVSRISLLCCLIKRFLLFLIA
jgi:hypothetical protein